MRCEQDLLIQICEDWASLTNRNSRILIHDAVFQKLRGKLDSESMSAPTPTLSRLASLVLPVALVEESKINAPNRNRLAEL